MKPKLKGRNWWGRRTKTSWSAGCKTHSDILRINESNQQVKDFMIGDSIVKTQENNKSEESQKSSSI